MANKEDAKRFGETLKETGRRLNEDLRRRGLDKDQNLVEKVKKIEHGCQEAAEYIKERTEK